MAQMDTSEGGGRHESKVKAKKMSTRVDLTPMVDLAFLLISFFMLTTTMSKPVAMQLAMPKPIEDPTKDKGEDVKESQVLTIILDKDDAVWYYEGIPSELTPESLNKTHYGSDGIRQVILDKQKKVLAHFREPDKTICLIKMTKDASYKNMVDILDEMDITKTKIFAIQDLSPVELSAVSAK
ncbi:MAG: biopolymer transporter ExbD [Chitinophagales bacterium]|nr:biopolymer transporter ExbD [Chitinophagales bacterium]